MTEHQPLESQPQSQTTDDSVVFRARFISAYILSTATMIFVIGKPTIALALWLLDLPVIVYANILHARRLGEPWWIGLLCAPLAPFAGTLLRRIARKSAVRKAALPFRAPMSGDVSQPERPPRRAA